MRGWRNIVNTIVFSWSPRASVRIGGIRAARRAFQHACGDALAHPGLAFGAVFVIQRAGAAGSRQNKYYR